MAAATPKFKMNYRFLGKTGLKVSEICLGAMTFSKKGQGAWGMPAADEKESHQMLDAFIAAGGNFIDTANVYGGLNGGESEEVIGSWLANKPAGFRHSVIIATKVRLPVGKGVNDQGLSRKHILDSVDASLKRMNTTYIDLYQIHTPDDSTPMTEFLGTLNDLVHQGKVRYVGASNLTGWQLQKYIDFCNSKGWEPFVCLQPQYSLICRSIEFEILDVCINEGIGVIPWSPLAGGWLSGRYKKGMSEPPKDSRVAWAEQVGWTPTNWSSKNENQTWTILEECERIANAHSVTVAQVALRWLVQRPGVTSPIIGAKSMSQLLDNLNTVNWALTEEEMKKLNDVSAIPLPYPYNMVGRYKR